MINVNFTLSQFQLENMDFSQEYKRYLANFSLLTKESFELSIQMSELLLNFREVSNDDVSNDDFLLLSLFSKIALNADSILTLLPKGDPRSFIGTENSKFLDLSSIASLSRDVIDASNALFYLFTERVGDSEHEFRVLLFGLHGWMRQKEFIESVGGPNQEMLFNVSIEVDKFKNQLEANSFFKGLEGEKVKRIFKRTEGRIENVKAAMFLTRREITRIRGIDLSFSDAIYMFFSSHVHSFLMSVSLVGQTITLSEKSLLFLLLTIKYAAYYLGLSLVDATMLFPEVKEKLSFESKELLANIVQGKF